jgi:hypothetical protein
VRVKILRCVWETGWSGAVPTRPWPDQVFTDTFQAANGWSVRDFWRRSSFGHADVDFDIGPWAVLQGGAQERLKDDRAGIIAAFRHQAERDHVSLTGYEHVVAFVHEPPSDVGTSGGDLVLDQTAPESYRREVGRLIGFGPAVSPYCVMGGGACRVAGATLVRYSRTFRASASAARVGVPSRLTLTALSEATGAEPAVAVVPADGGEVAVEYRTAYGDDENLPPAVVLHSIGEGVRFETALAPAEGEQADLHGVRVTVLATSPTTVTLSLSECSPRDE